MPNTVGRVEKSYARGSVTASNGSAGGLIGQALFMEVDQTYASGAVSGVSSSLTGVGGLIGIEGYSASGVLTSAPNTVTNSFYDTQTTGQGPAAPGTSKQTAEMNTTATFTRAGWDFTFQSGVWGRKDSVNDKYPVLRTFGYTDPLTLTLTDATKVYGDANPAFPFVSVIGCPTINCVAAGWGSAISPTTGRGVYSYSDPNVIGLLFANGYAANQFEITFSDNSLAVSARPITLNTGATRSYNALTSIAGSLLVAGNVVNGDAVNLGGSATLASKNAGTYSLSAAGLTLDNANYTLAGVIPSATVLISPRTLHLSFAVADKTFDGNTAASATASDNRISGDQLKASFSAAFGDTNAGLVKPVTISGLALQGADSGNYQFASSSSTGVTGNMLARNLTYALVAQDPTRTYTATGQVLVSAAALDQLVVATLANTISGTSPGALSYTLWQNGQQVSGITQAGTYEIRANFATPDAHYALATTGNSTLTLTVSAATPGTPGATPTLPTTLFTASTSSALNNTIGQAVRTEVQSNAAMLASAGVSAARPLAEIVNGGVKLPSGVDQLLFVVKAGQ